MGISIEITIILWENIDFLEFEIFLMIFEFSEKYIWCLFAGPKAFMRGGPRGLCPPGNLVEI